MGWFTRLDPVSRSDRSWLYWSYCVHAARLESKLATAISSASLHTQQSPLAASKAVWSLYLGLLCPNPMSTQCAGFCSYQVAELGHAHLEIPHKWPRLLLLFLFLAQTKFLTVKSLNWWRKPQQAYVFLAVTVITTIRRMFCRKCTALKCSRTSGERAAQGRHRACA